MAFTIRAAEYGDEELVVALLYELAEYEKLTDKFKITKEIAARDFIGKDAALNVSLLYENDKPAGIATWYCTYSSFAAMRGIFLEDLFVRPEFRGRGFGKALFVHLTNEAVHSGARYIEWMVLDWNTPAIGFYEGLGAERSKGQHIYRLTGEALVRLAG